MCGIFGISLSSTQISQSLFRESLELIHHRGPDKTGEFFHEDQDIALGHKRLSIIDLSDQASQPMSSIDGRHKVIFNGEIYNYNEIRSELNNLGCKFNSSSDTEVLLNAYIYWGPECVEKFRGMFAFAIYDQVKKIIFLSRDRAGEKPLFYAVTDGDLFFGSEIKPLINYSEKLSSINKNSFSYLFQNGYTPKGESIFSEIFKLKAGHSLTFDLEKRNYLIKKYWQIAAAANKRFRYQNEDHLVKELEKRLEESVELQLNSDVPVGILLSGGLDSSLITAIASRLKDKIDTFTVSFAGHGSFDEAPYAKEISDTFQTNHHLLVTSDINPEIIEKLTYFYDDPMFDPSIIPSYLISEAISENFKVALSGDGGDELFGGYNHYSKLLKLKNLAYFFPLKIRKLINLVTQNILPIGTKGRKTIELFSTDFLNSLANINEFFSQSEQEDFFYLSRLTNLYDGGKSSQEIASVSNDYLFSLTRYDFENYLSEDMLVKMDRASMANSLEIRAPFLDKKLIEYAFYDVPSAYKVSNKNQKILLKKLAEKILPQTFDVNRKQGFAIPLANFLIEEKWKDYFLQTISDSDSNFINKNNCIKMMRDEVKIYQNAGRLFGLIFFIHWSKRFKLNL
jgi:asparagine synthase (glutamine-hydrolysing)